MLKVPDGLSLTSGERAILTATLQNPTKTNRQIATETATRVATVRDTREAYEERVELQSDGQSVLTKPTDSASFNEAERKILETAVKNPARTNAEIAEQTGTRVALVRDTRAAYEDEVELAPGRAAASDSDADEADTVVTGGPELSETQQAILDAIAQQPARTNAEIAEQTGTRIALVRDTRAAYGDNVESKARDAPHKSETASPSGVKREILDEAAANPTLTNAEIAERTGARIALVRDTRAAHSGEAGAEDASDRDGDTDGTTVRQEILAIAEENPLLTNAEIAEQTGTRVALVRDTRDDTNAV